MMHSDDPRAADVFDFVDAYAAAQERGEDPPLAHWLARFPASQEAVAREWLALRRGAESAGATAGAGALEAAGPDRIGPYRLIRELGRGGQGAVFLAEDTRILRRVALKVLASRFDTIRDDKLRRFRREAEIIARLEHPSLCTVYEADLAGDTPYIAMRYVEGRTLADVLSAARRAHEAGAPDDARADPAGDGIRLDATDEAEPRAGLARFPPRSKADLDRVLLFFERAARALHAAHEAGVVHRDVKPGNMIVAADGKPVLLDFGLAREESAEAGAAITESGEVFGTPAYMSPEQLDSPGDELDRRTDVYALGVALYEALALRRPFEHAARAALYLAIQREPPPDPRAFNPHLPEDAAVVVATALEKDRARRYATALDLAEDLRRIRQYEPIRARPAGVGLRFARWIRRHPALAAATIGTIASLSAGLLVALDLLAAEKHAVAQKEGALREKDQALSVALGKHLAQRSIELAEEDASAALALGVLAAERAPGYQTLSALYPALEHCWLERVLEGDDDSGLMTALAFDPAGSLVAGAFQEGDHGVLYAWNFANGARVARVAPGRGSIDAIDLDPRGETAVLATSEGLILLARLADGALVAERATGQRATRCEYSPDGERVLARAAVGAARVLDARTLAVVAESAGPLLDARWLGERHVLLAGLDAARIADAGLAPLAAGTVHGVQAADVAPDGLVWALAREDGTLEARDEHGALVSTFRPAARSVARIAPAPGGAHVALILGEGADAQAWIHARDGQATAVELPDRRTPQRLVWSPDGERLAVVTGDTSVHVVQARGARVARTFALPKRQLDAAWSPDGARLVTATNGFAHAWFTRTRPDVVELAAHAGAVVALRAARDGAQVLSASADGSAQIARLDGTGSAVRCAGRPGAAALVDALYADGGTRVVTADAAGWLRAHAADSGEELDSTWIPGGAIRALCAHPDSAVVVCVSGSGEACAWDASEPGTGRRVLPAPRDGSRVTAAAFLPDGAHVALGTAGGHVEILSAATFERVAEHAFGAPGAPPSGVVALDVAPRGGELVVAGADRALRFRAPFPPADARPPPKFFDFRAVSWDPTATYVLALGQQAGPRSVRVLDVARGQSTSLQSAHRGSITCAAFAADGTAAITGATDGSVHVWSTRDGAPLVQRAGLGAAVTSLAQVAGPAGPSVAAGLADGRVRVFPLDPLAAARKRQPRALADWEQRRERALAAPLPFD